MNETFGDIPHRIAVLLPCHNEETTIAAVVRDFRAALPAAAIYVYDNNSTDRTAQVARAAGAIVVTEPLPGKGHVVCRMFADIEAEIYVLADGDGTYDAARAPELIAHLLHERLDMVCGARVSTARTAYRRGHRWGNRLLTQTVTLLFGRGFQDLLTGYRVFSRRFVKSFPVLSRGFELETQLSIHALQMQLRVAEIATAYRPRPQGSTSKLNTIRDGWRIVSTIALLVKEERPLVLFTAIFIVLAATSIVLAIPVVIEFMHTGLVPRFPTAILATGMMLLAFLSLMSGLILDSVARSRKEIKRLYYLALPPPTVAALGTPHYTEHV